MKYQNRWVVTLLVILLFVSFSLASCGGSENTPDTTGSGATAPESSPEVQEPPTEPAPTGEIKIEKIQNYQTRNEFLGMDFNVTTWRITNTFQTPRFIDLGINWRDSEGFLVDGPAVRSRDLTGDTEFPIPPMSSIIARGGRRVDTASDKIMELIAEDKGDVVGYESGIKILSIGKPDGNSITVAVENTGTSTRHMAYANIIGIDASGQPVFGWIDTQLFELPPGEKAKWDFQYNSGESMPEDKWAKTDVVLSVISTP